MHQQENKASSGRKLCTSLFTGQPERPKLVVAALLLTALLSACDGGIFGTGSGSVDIGTDGLGSPGVNTPEGQGSDTPSEGIQFSNTTAVLPGDQPIVKLVNGSQRELEWNWLGDHGIELSLSISVGEAKPLNFDFGTGSGNATGTGTTYALTTSSPIALQTANTVYELAAGSLTTAIARESYTGDSLDLLFTASRANSDQPELSDVRLVQVSASAGDEASTVLLIPVTGNPGSTVELGPVRFDSAEAVTSYQPLSPGQYTLDDNLDGFDGQRIELLAGGAYTLLLDRRDNRVTVLLDGDPSQ